MLHMLRSHHVHKDKIRKIHKMFVLVKKVVVLVPLRSRAENQLSFGIFRKQTTTDTIIPRDSCHPLEHKIAAMRYYVNTINTYYLDQDKKQKEINTAKQILKSNNYETAILYKIHNKTKKQEQDNGKKKWEKFTNIGRETRYITKLFKNSNVKIAYTTNNNLGKLLTRRTDQHLEKYDANGICQLECPTCNKEYIGQTGRQFRTRFHKHYDYKYANNRSKFTQHVIEEGHNFGSMNEIMEADHIARKRRMLDTLEKFYTYRETKLGNQSNNKLTIQSNLIFEVPVQHTTRRGLQLHI